MKKLIRKFRLLLPMLVFFIIYMVAFGILERHQADYYHVPYTRLDGMIPFVEFFIVPYILWFIFVPAVVLYLLFNDEEEYRNVCIRLMAGMSVFVVISALFPTRIFLRPLMMPRDNVFCDMVRGLYSIDTSTNVFPSIHVYNTLAVLWAVLRSRTRLFTERAIRVGSTVLSILIVFATVFLKQHSVIDVAGAVVLFWAVNRVIAARRSEYRLIPLLVNRR